MSVLPTPAPSASAAQRRALRRARIGDAIRLLPLLGVLLFVLPDLALSGGPAAAGATAPWLIYLFAAWFLLVGLAAWLGYLHTHAEETPAGPRDG
ncbi:hypothetical protein SAMN05444004_10834 [Jannaschia faecimaris]|uniref:DUF485 domain-containing protein n=1 Tax=Jannaschia faecimaris TaxID=1244108 RepID=A0A1H3RA86_9RHOB|nr:hypothetical protein [Jannaschia faecimaris]SDZ22674.1 hypothetical protein SAMN05444004_10834 [Jannaschia faecimaris]